LNKSPHNAHNIYDAQRGDNMTSARNTKLCAGFKSLERGIPFDYTNIHSVNCKDCMYFSSRNCGMDAVSYVEPEMALYM